MNKHICYILVFLFPMIAFAGTNNPINKKNWSTHPRIKEIRKIYSNTENLIASNRLISKKRKFEYCVPYVDTDREMFVNKNEDIRKYFNSKGSDDSAVTQSFYYDDKGMLRFIFAKCGAVEGTRLEVRIYLDDNGKRIWENRKLLEGSGYTFPNPWPVEEFVFDPKKAFESPNECEEVK